MKAFTLIEVVLTLAVLSLLMGIGAPFFASFQNRNNLDVAANTIAQTLRRGQMLSQGSSGDTTWGVHVASGSITLFKGASYGARDATYDEVFDMASTITPTGTTDIVYSHTFGIPQSTGTLTLTSTVNNTLTRALTVNAKGTISY